MNEENDIIEDLTKWLHANGIQKPSAEELYNNIDAGDLVTLITAFEHKDHDTIAQIFNKTKAEMSSNFNSIKESYSLSSMFELENLYQKLPVTSYRTDYLSEAHLRTLIYDAITEGIVSSMNSAKSSTGQDSVSNTVNQNSQQLQNAQNNQIQQTANTPNNDNLVTAQQKQQILKQDPNTKVTFGGIGNEDDVLGTQLDPSDPNNSMVVVKDPNNQNQVKVLNINDVNLIDQDSNG